MDKKSASSSLGAPFSGLRNMEGNGERGIACLCNVRPAAFEGIICCGDRCLVVQRGVMPVKSVTAEDSRPCSLSPARHCSALHNQKVTYLADGMYAQRHDREDIKKRRDSIVASTAGSDYSSTSSRPGFCVTLVAGQASPSTPSFAKSSPFLSSRMGSLHSS